MTDDDDRDDDAELREAEALAEALERAPEQRGPAATEADAIDAADLIAASRLPELSPARAAAVLQEATARIAAQRARRRRRALGFGALGAGTLAAAAAAMLMVTANEPRVASVSMAPQFEPETREAQVRDDAARAARLAQIAWLGNPTPANRAAAELRLGEYRAVYLAQLERRSWQ